MATNDEVLREIRFLKVKLYGENGFEGDITKITDGLKGHDNRISRNSRILYTIVGVLSASGIGFGIGNLIG